MSKSKALQTTPSTPVLPSFIDGLSTPPCIQACSPGWQKGTTGIILATSSFLVQGHLLRWTQLATTESNPSHANWRHENSPSVQPVSSFKECSPCMTEGWKLLAGHPAQPPHSRTNYSSLLWPSNHDSDSSKKIPHKTSINTKCT